MDQPVGTGFSYVNTDSFLKDLPEMAEHMMIFLDKFLSLFPEYQSDDVYLAGESFAGQHIPYICKALLDRNKKDASRFVPIKGILIGNGWIDPQRTYLSYLPFAYQSGILQGGSDAAAVVENRVSACSKSLSSLGNRIHVVECEAVLQEILAQTRTSGKCINMYDLRLRDSFPSCGMNWPPDLDYVRPYLRQDSVLRALHVSPDKTGGWVECSGQVSGVFLAQDSRPAIELLPDILAELPVLLFSGDKDVICNFRGTEEAIKALDWNGGTGLEDSNGNLAVVDEWTFNGMPAGNYQTARNLTHVIVYNASHMVPFDYARQSLDMLNRFVGLDISNDAAFESGLVGGDLRNQKPSEDRPPESNNSIENDSVKQATWLAYQRAGEIVLVVVILGAFAFGTFVYRQRKKDSRGIYFRGNGSNIRLNRAMENENELDELVLESPDASLDSFVGETISPKD